MSEPQVVVVDDINALSDEAAARIERAALDAPEDATTSIALAGGHTPRGAYQHLADRRPPWERMQFFFGDERLVPADDPGSNYHMAYEALFSRASVPDAQVHRIRGELPPEDAAREAAGELAAHVAGEPWPRLDLVLLGMGPDGHTASLFPGAAEVGVADRTTVPVHRPDLPQPWRVSMTLPVLNAARRVMFLVAGEDKADVAARAVAGDASLPAGMVRPADGELTWLITRDAATKL